MLMKEFIGTKKIKAVPMNRGNYNKYRGWELPADEDGADPGFLVEYLPDASSKPNHPDHEGYISWSPAPVFLRSYKALDGMTLGLAIEAMRQGFSVARKGWNGKGIFLRIAYPGSADQMTQAFVYIDTRGLESDNPNASRCRLPWLPSQTDLLASDWVAL